MLTQNVMIPQDHLSQGNQMFRMLQMSQEEITRRTQVKGADPLDSVWQLGRSWSDFRKQYMEG